jgi:succinoglycan biosynthesis transport protein ExoP
LKQLPVPFNRLPEPSAVIEREADQPVYLKSDGGMSALQVVTILRFYWKITVLVAAVVVVAAAVGIKFMPKTFTATATLIVGKNKKDPLATQDAPENGLTSYVETQMEVITSPVILLQVVDRMDLTTDHLLTAGYRGNDPAELREYTARSLATNMLVEIGRGGQLLYVSASARYPARAAEIANAVTDVYLEEERRRSNEPAGDRARRYSEEVAELRAKVALAQENLAAYRQRKGMTDIPTAGGADSDTETQALVDLQTRLLDAQNQRRALEAKSSGQQSTADEALASPIIQQLKTQLAAQQTQLAQLSITAGAKHPKVQELRSQIALTSRQLNEELGNLSGNVSTQLARARQLEKQYTEAVDQQRAKVLHVRDLQGEEAKLALELDSAHTVYKRALDGFDQILFASAGNSADVSLISKATPPVKASKPNKFKLFILACFAGLGLGVAGPLGYELLLDRRLRCRDDIERGFGIPVLAEFDQIPLPSSA